jgi:hypothetical protein
MKKMIKSKYIIGMMALGFIALSQTSCGDAKDSEIDNLVYISEAAMAQTKTLDHGRERRKSRPHCPPGKVYRLGCKCQNQYRRSLSGCLQQNQRDRL